MQVNKCHALIMSYLVLTAVAWNSTFRFYRIHVNVSHEKDLMNYGFYSTEVGWRVKNQVLSMF